MSRDSQPRFETRELPLITATVRNDGVTLRPQTYLREIGCGEVALYDVMTNVKERINGIDVVVLPPRRP